MNTSSRTKGAAFLILLALAGSACSSKADEVRNVVVTQAPTTVATSTTTAGQTSTVSSLSTRLEALRSELTKANRTQEAASLSSAKDACGSLAVVAKMLSSEASFGQAGIIQALSRSYQAALLLSGKTASCGGTRSAAPEYAAMQVLSDSSTGFSFNLTPAAPTFALDRTALKTQSKPYSSMKGAPLRPFSAGSLASGEIGWPGRADYSTVIAVPVGSKPTITLTESSSAKLTDVLLAATQPQPADADIAGQDANDPLYSDKLTVIADPGSWLKGRPPYCPVPGGCGELALIGKSHGMTLYSISVPTIRYNAATRELVLVGLVKVNVSFGANTGEFSDAKNAGSMYDRGTGAIASMVANPTAVKKWQAPKVAQTNVTPCGPELLIVTPKALIAQAEQLKTAKRAAGYITQIYETSLIAGLPTYSDELKMYITKLANTDCAIKLSYVILLGDSNYIPAATYYSKWVKDSYAEHDIVSDGVIKTDAPYAITDFDTFPDLFIGRLPAATVTEAQTMVDKTIAYQNTPSSDPAFYKNATVTGYFQLPLDDDKNITSYTNDARGFSKTANTIADALSSKYTVGRVLTALDEAIPTTYWDGTAVPSDMRKPTQPWTGTGTDLKNAFNAGRFFALHRDHGGTESVSHPSFTSSEAMALTNKDKQGLVLLIDCLAGNFAHTSKTAVAEAFLKNSKGGAVAVIASAEISPSGENNNLTYGLVDSFYPALPGSLAISSNTMGEILFWGKLYQRANAGVPNLLLEPFITETYLYNLLGDPTLVMRKRTPAMVSLSTTLSMGTVTLNVGGAAASASSVYNPPFIGSSSVYTVFQGDTPVLRGAGSTIKGLKAGSYTVVLETPEESAVTAEFKL